MLLRNRYIPPVAIGLQPDPRASRSWVWLRQTSKEIAGKKKNNYDDNDDDDDDKKQ